MIRRWNPPGPAAPLGRYSHLATAPADHELLMISGQVGVLEDGTLAGPDAESQARQVFANIESLLRSAGAGPEHLIKLFTMLSGTEHLAGSRAAQGEVFARWYPRGESNQLHTTSPSPRSSCWDRGERWNRASLRSATFSARLSAGSYC
ncbi:RidA family protein [Streptosporangium sp. G11]|uniref:RidA family protein n=1 Tax=Streptosporangium sp. G11 TaxID=3436926 RepID=UPI003EB7D761